MPCAASTHRAACYSPAPLGVAAVFCLLILRALWFCRLIPAFNNVCYWHLDGFYIAAVSFKSSFGNLRLDLANFC